MTELYIDNQQVVLPLDFSIEVLNENPFFTKNGQYTYDLTLSLLSPVNAKIYKHYYRQNNDAPIVSNRSARLIVDNEVLLNGTEIILEITDKEVKIQLVSGESELNYFIGGDKKINKLDLVGLSEEFIPLYSINEERIFNPYDIIQNTNGSLYLKKPIDVWAERYQPYLYVIINKIIECLGYNLNTNVLENSDLKYLYLVNGKRTLHYNEMLPDWTVNEFLEEVEKLFNIVFLIEEQSKTVDIVFKYDYYERAEKYYVGQVIDSYEQKIDKENKIDYFNANIGYELPDDEYYRYQNLNPAILEKVEYITLGSHIAILDYIHNTSNKDSLRNKIFISLATNTQYIMWETKDSQGILSYDARKVNIFRPIENNPEDSDINLTFKICPAPIHLVEVNVSKESNRPSPDDILYQMIVPMPAIQIDPYNPRGSAGSEMLDLQETLENDSTVNKENSSPSNMYIAFYNGCHAVFEKVFSSISPRNIEYPFGFVDFLREDNRLGEYSLDANNLSLRLDDPYGLKPLYSQSKPIDTTREYSFWFIYGKKLDAKSIFIFNNKEFVCKELKRTIKAQGALPVIEGKFYPIS